MKFLEKLSDFVGKYMALIVLIVAGMTLFFPSTGSWIHTSWITPLLMIVMFGMGLTMHPNDLLLVLKRPKDVVIGVMAQYIIMPMIAYVLGRAFNLDEALLVGVVLVGCCPGGTSSNVMTYLAGADVPLSITMTSISTLLAPILTPAITYFLLRSTVEVDAIGMFISIVQVVILPIGAGFLINHFFHSITKQVEKILPLISVTAIVAIVASVVSANSERIFSVGYVILVVVILHNVLGYLLGYSVGKALKMGSHKSKAVSIEVGMQNSGLASSLANQAFSALPMATVPGAVFSVWHNISGAILAGIFRRIKD